MKRKLSELNLIDDFLFGSLMVHEKYGPALGKILVRTILGIDVPGIKVRSQMPVWGADTNYHGIRMDVYMDEVAPAGSTAAANDTFDIEPDNHSRKKDIVSLPKRIRFYHSLIDRKSLETSADYHSLRNVWVIMITSYDPLGYDRIQYTIRNQILEDSEIPYNDGATTVLLYTGGTKGSISDELRAMLRYFHSSTAEHAVNDTLRQVHQMVTAVKMDREVNDQFMKSWEYMEILKEEAQEEGFAKGLEEGRTAGLAEGRTAGLAEGRAEGRAEQAGLTQQERERADRAEAENQSLKQKIAEMEQTLKVLQQTLAVQKGKV